MNRPAAQDRPPVLVITGMHRSTTSLAASILADAGLHLGDELVAADSGNPEGHFEDVEFHLLQRRILAASGFSEEGFTCTERIDVPAPARDDAAALVTRRRTAGRPWGWKDPRTVLFLDFWAELLPEARWLFIVRSPVEVVDSLFRRGDVAFRTNPRLAADVWVAYNRRILQFVRERPQHTAVVRAEDVVADHAALVHRASTVLGMPLIAGPSRYRADLLVASQPAHRTALVQAATPEALGIFNALAALAGPGQTGLEPADGDTRPAEAAEAGLIEWNRGCRATMEQRSLATQLAAAWQALAAEREAHGLAAARAASLAIDIAYEQEARAEASARAERAERELADGRTAGEQAAARAAAAEAQLDALAAQFEAERGIYESLRQDLTGRIQVARGGHRRAG